MTGKLQIILPEGAKLYGVTFVGDIEVLTGKNVTIRNCVFLSGARLKTNDTKEVTC